VSRLIHGLNGWLNAALGLFYPEACCLCGQARATPEECFVCAGCMARIHPVAPPFCERCGRPFEGEITTAFECANCRDMELNFVWARSAVIAREEAREAIHRYKYQRALWLEPLLAGFLIAAAAPTLVTQSWDCIVPVPLHPTKQRHREFNQAERLGKRLGAATGIVVRNRLLKRVLPTESQTHLNRAERQANVRRAFAMRRGQRLNGERIVLVDDVFTTGATTSACAGVLREAGAGEVSVWTVARGV
jgi:ComF family protein